MIEHSNGHSARLTRRRILTLGAGAAFGAAAGLRPAAAVLRIDVTQGNIQPMPVALPDFAGGAQGDELAVGRQPSDPQQHSEQERHR